MGGINFSESDIGKYLFEQNPNPMIIFNRDSLDIEWVNKAAIDQYGYSRKEFTSLNIKQIRPKESIPKLIQDLDKATYSNHDTTYQHLTKSGERLYVQVQAEQFDLNGKNLQLAVIHNITEKVEANIRAQQAESLAQLGWWTYDTKSNRVLWSEGLYEIMGVKKENFEATFEGFSSLLHPEDQAKVDNIIKQVQETDRAFDYTIRVLDSNKEITHLRCRAQGIFDNEDKLLRIVGITQDITEQVHTQKELEKHSQAIASSMDGISTLNPDGEFVYMNQAHAEIYGYNSPNELLGKTWHVLYRDSDSTYFESNVMPQIEKEGWWRGEAEGKRKDETIFPQEVSLSSTTDGGLICVVRDITQRKKHQQGIEQALQEKETLLEEIHHRVKNNLAVVSSILELQKTEPVESVEELIEDTQSRIKSIGTIHEKLYKSQTLSDVEVGEYIEDFSEVVLASFNSAQKNITITKNLQEYKLDTKRAVPLGLIVNELLSNAFKHGFSGIADGEIKISLEVNDNEVVLKVADNGNPLPNNYSIEDQHSMGMSLVKTLTNQLEGTYNTTQNGWTTFEIRFPKAIPKDI